MKLKFLGVGSAFTTPSYYHSNAILTASNGKKLLLDCGSDIRFSLAEAGVTPAEIDAVYLSHQHADHIGGMEFLAYTTFFNPHNARPKLFIEETLADEVWDASLKGGLSIVDDQPRGISDFFEPRLQQLGTPFTWEGIQLTLYKMPHVMTQVGDLFSYGLLIEQPGRAPVFFSSDATFAPEILLNLPKNTGLIFHDCETATIPTGVHCHYNELCQLPPELKAKLWLYHYQPNPPFQPTDDGFLGFVQKGQEFEL